MKIDLTGVGREGRMRARDGGVEMDGGDISETGSVSEEEGKQKSTTTISASLTPGLQG